MEIKLFINNRYINIDDKFKLYETIKIEGNAKVYDTKKVNSNFKLYDYDINKGGN